MENDDGTHSHPGEEEADATTNVVRFPRDWFGPREELVPFGPRASGPADGEAGPVRPDDFWGEASASIHDAMERPAVREPVAAAVAAPRVRRFVRPRVRLRSAAVAGAVAACCLLVAAVVGSVWPAAVRGPEGGRSAVALGPAMIEPPAIVFRRTAGTTSDRAHGSRERTRHRPAGRRPAVSRARARVTEGSGSGGGAGAVSSSGSGSSPAVSSAPSEGSNGSSGGSSTPAQASSDSGGGGTSSQSAGPVGPGAPFGPGHLG